MGRRSDEKWEFWRVAVELQQESGFSVAKFCEREGLRPPTFFAWRKKIVDDNKQRSVHADSPVAQDGRLPSPEKPSSSFAEVEVVDDQPLMIEVVAPNGIVIRVPEASSARSLKQVVAALAATK